MLLQRAQNGQHSLPIAAVLQMHGNSSWVTTLGDEDFQQVVSDMGLLRMMDASTEVVRHPQALSAQLMQGLSAVHQLVDLQFIVVMDDFGQAFFLSRMVESNKAWLGRLSDPAFDDQLRSLNMTPSKLNVDTLKEDDYLTRSIAG